MTAPDLSMAQISRRMLSAKAEQFTESVIREMTRLALKHSAVNLSQGFPDFAAPEDIKEAARKAIADYLLRLDRSDDVRDDGDHQSRR